MSFKGLSEDEIRQSFMLSVSPNSKYTLPLLVVVDFSGSCQDIMEKEKHIVKKLYEEFTDYGNVADAFMILAVIHECHDSNDKPKIVYSGRMANFPINEFMYDADICNGKTPLVNMLSTSVEYLDEFVAALDNAKPRPIVHTCPTILFITDYMDNASNDTVFKEIVGKLTRDFAERKRMIVEFLLTDEQANNANVDNSKRLTFGGFTCRFDDQEINKFVKALKTASSTVTATEDIFGDVPAEPSSDPKKFNDQLRKAMFYKMETLWNRLGY